MAGRAAALAGELEGAWSTRAKRIEYGGFLSNHLGQGAVAIARLGAGAQRAREFAAWYQSARPLEDASAERREEAGRPALVGFASDLVGRRERFAALCSYYEGRVRAVGRPGAVAESFGRLSHGLAGSAFHGLIQLGYGYAAGVDRMVAEGLAYMHYSCQPLAKPGQLPHNPPTAESFEQVASVLQAAVAQVRADGKLTDVLRNHLAEFDNLPTSSFQRKMQCLGQYATQDLTALSMAAPTVSRDPGWLVDLALTLFVDTALEESVDFFMLHGVTSAWAFSQLAPAIRNFPAAQVHFINALLATYVVQGAPELAPTSLTEEEGDSSTEWAAIIEAALEHHRFRERDEHVYKLTQVAWERARDGSALDEAILKKAAQLVIHRPFRY